MTLADDVKDVRYLCEDGIDAIDLEKFDAEIMGIVDKIILSLRTLLMKDDGTIN